MRGYDLRGVLFIGRKFVPAAELNPDNASSYAIRYCAIITKEIGIIFLVTIKICRAEWVNAEYNVPGHGRGMRNCGRCFGRKGMKFFLPRLQIFTLLLTVSLSLPHYSGTRLIHSWRPLLMVLNISIPISHARS